MANIKFTNLAGSTLQVAINNLATSVTIDPADVAKFPSISGSEYFIIVLITSAGDFEIMRVTAVNSNVFTVMRAQEGTPARAFAVGDKVEHRLTAESLVTIVEEASITKPHTSTDADAYGHATSTLFSHVKITDETNSSASSILGIGISPYAVKTRFDQLLGASNQNVITASGSYVVPETGTYEVVVVGGGGSGGNGSWGGWGHEPTCNGGGVFYSGGGGGGGGAGQVLTQQISLTAGVSVPVIVGSSGGNTSFGSYAVALSGLSGNNATDATCVRGECYAGSCSDWSIGHTGYGGSAGYSYGSPAITGASGGTSSSPWATISGGAGGTGGVSVEGIYGNGGNGGTGGYAADTSSGFSYGTPASGTKGTQGCIKIRLVLGS